MGPGSWVTYGPAALTPQPVSEGPCHASTDCIPAPPYCCGDQGTVWVLTCHQATRWGAHPRLGVYSRPGRQHGDLLVAVGTRGGLEVTVLTAAASLRG